MRSSSVRFARRRLVGGAEASDGGGGLPNAVSAVSCICYFGDLPDTTMSLPMVHGETAGYFVAYGNGYATLVTGNLSCLVLRIGPLTEGVEGSRWIYVQYQ